MTIPFRTSQNLCLIVAVLAVVLLAAVPSRSWAEDSDVEAAIKKGTLYIQRLQLRDGSWHNRGHRLGETALAGLALLAAGQPSDSAPVDSAARAVRQLAVNNNETYDVSLAVMFLDRIGNSEDSALIRRLGERLANGRLPMAAGRIRWMAVLVTGTTRMPSLQFLLAGYAAVTAQRSTKIF
jgi:hypothetical protein